MPANLENSAVATLCDPIDGSPPSSPVPGILQAKTLEWVAISFSSIWKWIVKVKSLSRVCLRDPMDCSLLGSSVHGIFQARVLEWGAIAFSEVSCLENTIKTHFSYLNPGGTAPELKLLTKIHSLLFLWPQNSFYKWACLMLMCMTTKKVITVQKYFWFLSKLATLIFYQKYTL